MWQTVFFLFSEPVVFLFLLRSMFVDLSHDLRRIMVSGLFVFFFAWAVCLFLRLCVFASALLATPYLGNFHVDVSHAQTSEHYMPMTFCEFIISPQAPCEYITRVSSKHCAIQTSNS